MEQPLESSSDSPEIIDEPNIQVTPTRDRLLLMMLTALFGVAVIINICILYRIWPSSLGNGSVKNFLFLHYIDISNISIEQQYFLLVIFGGALGAFLSIIVSFTAFVGNKQFVSSWLPWYLLRPLIGSGMALVFYLLLRGGLMSYSPSTSPNKEANNYAKLDSISNNSTTAQLGTKDSLSKKDSTAELSNVKAKTISKDNNTASSGSNQNGNLPLNPFGMLAIACLAGLFSKQASGKLQEVFEAMFNIKQPVDYKDPLKKE